MPKTLRPARDFDIDLHFPEERGEEGASMQTTKNLSASDSVKPSLRKRRKGARIYRGVLTLKRTTAGTAVYGNHDLRAQYIPKEVLQAVSDGQDYPQELVIILRTTAKHMPNALIRRPQNGHLPSAERSNH